MRFSQSDFFCFYLFCASLISPPDPMIQISGWFQNVAMTCRYNLTESDFLFSISLIQKESFPINLPSFFRLFQKNFPKKSTNHIFKNRALLSCSGKCWLHFDTNPKSVSLDLEEKSGTHGHLLF